MQRHKHIRATRVSSGFSTVELNIVVLVIAVLIFFLLPGMMSLVSDARVANVKQDAAGIGAAIEVLKLEGKFYTGDAAGLSKLIYETAGVEYKGHISKLQHDGSFIYNRTDGGIEYSVRYDSATGAVEEVK